MKASVAPVTTARIKELVGEVLRRIQDAPPGPGLGRGAVQYWLGIALDRAGASYLDAAREALEQAAADPEARLYHHDGPWVAPRARARLAVLGAS